MIIREMAFDDISQVAEIERENSLTPLSKARRLRTTILI